MKSNYTPKNYWKPLGSKTKSFMLMAMQRPLPNACGVALLWQPT